MGLKASELRIGNLIEFTGKQINVSFGTFLNVIKNPEKYEPITLTEERLLKFEEIYLLDKGSCSTRYSYREYHYVFGGFYLSKEFELCTEDYQDNYMPELGVKIEFVHQLQNIFYYLNNNEELTIK